MTPGDIPACPHGVMAGICYLCVYEPLTDAEFIRELKTFPDDTTRYAETLWFRCREAARRLEKKP